MINVDDFDGDLSLSASAVVEELKASGGLDALFSKIDSGSLNMTGPGGFIPELIKAALERGLQAELSSHLGYEKGDPGSSYYPNSRNGSSSKTMRSEIGSIELDIPRDRNGTFDPRLVRKGDRRLGGLDDMIISLYAGGMTIRDIQYHLASTIGTELSHETISKITDAVLEEVMSWQQRPLDAIYPVIFLDALVTKVKDGAHVRNKAAHLAIGVDMEGIKHVLGIWIQNNEGAKFWAGVCADIANRGVKDVLIVCCDGLTGFSEAVQATWPEATIQTCTVHLLRSATRLVSYKDRRKVAVALKPIYTASNEDESLQALTDFSISDLGKQYPSAVSAFENAWDRFTPFLAFPPELRRVIYTTNAIESLNYQLRKIIKNRGHFPTDQAAVKLMWLAISNIEDKHARKRTKEEQKNPITKPRDKHLEGTKTANWPQALAQLALIYPERINQHL